MASSTALAKGSSIPCHQLQKLCISTSLSPPTPPPPAAHPLNPEKSYTGIGNPAPRPIDPMKLLRLKSRHLELSPHKASSLHINKDRRRSLARPMARPGMQFLPSQHPPTPRDPINHPSLTTAQRPLMSHSQNMNPLSTQVEIDMALPSPITGHSQDHNF